MISHRVLPALVLIALLSGCASGGATPSASDAGPSDAEWRRLATPRPAPLEGAPRIALSSVDLAGVSFPGAADVAGVSLDATVLELIAAGLLRRRDVEFVERRRFLAAEEAERQGVPRPPGAAPLGTSRGAELLVEISWLRLGTTSVAELRLVDPTSGGIVASDRIDVPADAGPVGFARFVTGALLGHLSQTVGLPEWADPEAEGIAVPDAPLPIGAFDAFREGTAAEDLSRWEAARRAYLRASELAGGRLIEAEVALARSARLRTGGTLGGS